MAGRPAPAGRARPGPAAVRLVGALLALSLAFGAGFGARAWQTPTDEARAPGFGLFWEAWELVRQRYVEPDKTDPAALTRGAIAGMVDSLGDEGHTRYLSAEERQAWLDSLQGQYVGIGVEVSIRDERPVVIAPIPGSPAEAAGIVAGDVILAVDGQETTGAALDSLAPRLRGPAGSRVTLTLRSAQGGTEREVSVERRAISVASVGWALLPGTPIALVRVSSFAEDTTAELAAALRAASAGGARALILDLRDNLGGVLSEGIATAGEFLPAGAVVVQVQDRDGNRAPERATATSTGLTTGWPMAVLINRSSASSAEIVAGALQDHGRATLIGERTYGTGTVLSTFTLSDGSAVLLGTALWLTPNGQRIKGQGIQPDVPVSLPADVGPLLPPAARGLTPEQLGASPDTQVRRAVEILTPRLG